MDVAMEIAPWIMLTASLGCLVVMIADGAVSVFQRRRRRRR
jgi:hypothetical protein